MIDQLKEICGIAIVLATIIFLIPVIFSICLPILLISFVAVIGLGIIIFFPALYAVILEYKRYIIPMIVAFILLIILLL